MASSASSAPAAAQLLEALEFKEDYRCFNAGETVSFRAGVNLIVGEQGSGKSSLLGLLAGLSSRYPHERKEAEKAVTVRASAAAAGAGGFKLRLFDFEKDSPRTKAVFVPGMELTQVTSRFVSHGETVNGLLDQLATAAGGAPCLLSLDEPDMALSPRSARRLAARLEDLAAAGHQVLAAVHNPIVIASQRQVLSLEHRRWMSSRSFLQQHARD